MLIICMVELVSLVGKEGCHQYFKHRRDMIDANREEELISSRIKKISSTLYNSMSRHNTPQKIEMTIHTLDEMTGDHIPDSVEGVIGEVADGIADVYKDDISELGEDVKDNIKKVLENMPVPLPKKTRKAILGFNPQKISEIINNVNKRFKTPIKERSNLMTQEVIEEKKPIDKTEFHNFVGSVLIFLKNEFVLHEEDANSYLLKQRDYHKKLTHFLADVQKKK